MDKRIETLYQAFQKQQESNKVFDNEKIGTMRATLAKELGDEFSDEALSEFPAFYALDLI